MAADTIRVIGVGCVLIGPEGRTPPLPFITVDAKEGAALIAQKLAAEVAGDDEPAAPAPPAPPAPPPPEPEPEPVVTPPAPKKAAKPAPAAPAPEPEKVPEGGEDRAETIRHALDLVEGEATPEAVAEITGLADVTAEEVAAAVAARDAE